METLKITKSNAILAYEQTPGKRDFLANLFGKDIFQRPAIERIKTYEDACKDQGFKPLTISAFNFLPAEGRKYAFASHKVTTIIKSLNEGWVPNWVDGNEPKYYVWYKYTGSGSGFSYFVYYCADGGSFVGSRLHFKSKAIAQYFANQFIKELNSYFTL